MKKLNIYFYVAIYALAILSFIAIAFNETGYTFPLTIVMNILAYKMVLRKYKKRTNERVENNTNEMVLLYLCKIGGCYWIAYFFCFMFIIYGRVIMSSYNGILLLLFIIIFNITPSVKKGVRVIQDNYIYRQTKK